MQRAATRKKIGVLVSGTVQLAQGQKQLSFREPSNAEYHYAAKKPLYPKKDLGKNACWYTVMLLG